MRQGEPSTVFRFDCLQPAEALHLGTLLLWAGQVLPVDYLLMTRYGSIPCAGISGIRWKPILGYFDKLCILGTTLAL